MSDIIKPDGDVYMTVEYADGKVFFKNFSSQNFTIAFDVKVLPQLIPMLVAIMEDYDE